MNVWGNTPYEKVKNASRFYCSDNEACNEAEAAIKAAGINYVKIESDVKDPLLITGHKTCRGLNDVLSYTVAFSAIRKKYSVDWS